MKTSVHIKPCNIGTSEAHNMRASEYMARINADKIYVRQDLSHFNEQWIATEMEGRSTLTQRVEEIAAMVKAKTGRKMRTDERERVSKKTGTTKKVNGCSPLREGVVVVQETTTMEQLRRFCQNCNEKWGITALQIFIHRDEGHFADPEDKTSWKPNYHAHIVWDWMNWDTGKSIKLRESDMRDMQTLLAHCLEMERGTSKEETGAKHLKRNDLIIAKQARQMEELKEREEEIREEAKAARKYVEQQLEQFEEKVELKVQQAKETVKQARREAELEVAQVKKQAEKEVQQVRRQAEEEKAKLRKGIGKAIGQRIGQAVGVGKLADAERRVQQLEEEVKAGKAAAEKQHRAEMRAAQGQLQKLKEKVEEVQQQLSEREEEVKDVRLRLARVAVALCEVSDAVRVAVLAIIDFAKNQYQSILHREQVAAVKAAAREREGEDKDDQQQAGGMLCDCAAAIGKLTFSQRHKAELEVQDAILGKYGKVQHESEDQQEQRGRKR